MYKILFQILLQDPIKDLLRDDRFPAIQLKGVSQLFMNRNMMKKEQSRGLHPFIVKDSVSWDIFCLRLLPRKQ